MTRLYLDPAGVVVVAELIARVGNAGGGYRDGDVIHAATDRCILTHNAQRHLGKKDPKTNNCERANPEGFLDLNDPLFDYYSETHEFKFEHFGQGLLAITRLSDNTVHPVEEGKPHDNPFSGKTEVMAVREYIKRRRRSHRARGKNGVHMFGTHAREVWFGGKKDMSLAKIENVWTQIENKLQIAKADNRNFPLGTIDTRHAIGIPVVELTEDHAAFIESPGRIPDPNPDPERPDEQIEIRRRTSRVDYRNLPGLDPAIARRMADRQIPVDIRDYGYVWEVNEILLEFDMNSAVAIAELADEIRLDPLGRGYAGMDDAEILASLREVNRTFVSPVTSGELLAWGAAEGRLARISSAAANSALPDVIRAAAMGAEIMVKRDNTDLDLNKADRVALLQGLVDATILTEADKTALEALASTTGSRAEELFGEGVELYSGHITWAKKINSGQ